MSQLKQVVEPFGEVNVYPHGGKTRVVATILMEPHKEGAQTGIAIDGSASMSKLFGLGARPISPLFGGNKATNEVAPVAQRICAYLARKLDSDGGTTAIYWSVGMGGSEVQVIGDLTAEQAEQYPFKPPEDLGTGTQLLPAVRYFVERFQDAPFGFYAFITDGELHDLNEVKAYSVRLAKDIAAGKRRPVKFVLIGLGDQVNEVQMTELDDLETGTDVDLWDHKLAAEMRQLADIFAEVVDKNTRVAESGKILDPQGRVVKDYATGVPAYLEFEIDAGADYFTLEFQGNKVHQPLRPGVSVPAATFATATPTPGTAPSPQSNEPRDMSLPEDDLDAEWRDLPLELEKSDPDRKDGPDLQRDS